MVGYAKGLHLFQKSFGKQFLNLFKIFNSVWIRFFNLWFFAFLSAASKSVFVDFKIRSMMTNWVWKDIVSILDYIGWRFGPMRNGPFSVHLDQNYLGGHQRQLFTCMNQVNTCSRIVLKFEISLGCFHRPLTQLNNRITCIFQLPNIGDIINNFSNLGNDFFIIFHFLEKELVWNNIHDFVTT